MTIDVNALDRAVAEARRFLDTVDEVRIRGDLLVKRNGMPDYYEGGKHAAAVKRASMDLSRALAEVRRARP